MSSKNPCVWILLTDLQLGIIDSKDRVHMVYRLPRAPPYKPLAQFNVAVRMVSKHQTTLTLPISATTTVVEFVAMIKEKEGPRCKDLIICFQGKILYMNGVQEASSKATLYSVSSCAVFTRDVETDL